MRNVVVFVLGGGRGTRLFPLTEHRAKPAVPLGAKYRLIDIPLSNCINSGLNRIYVLTQFMSVSLHRHIRQSYRFDQFSGGFVEVLAAQETMEEGTDWYQGTADAVRKNMRYVEQPGIEYVLILSGDQLYRMDYQKMLQTHIQSGADVTIAAMPVDREAAKSLGVMKVDETGRVTGFLEKPQTPEETELVTMPSETIDGLGVDSKGRDCLASMGIYIFNRKTLCEALDKTDYRDFGKEIFPASIRTRKVQVHLFDDYWEDIGTIRAFYEANLALAKSDPTFKLALPEAPIYSRARFLPPTHIDGAQISGSLIADGCSIGRNTVIENSVIGLRCLIGDNVTIRDSIVMGADDFQRDEDLNEDAAAGRPPIGIGDRSVIVGAILDKNCRIGKDARICNDDDIQDLECSPACAIREGIPVVVKDATIPNGWQIEKVEA